MDRRFVIAGGAVILGGGFLLGRTVGTPWAPGGRRAPVRIGLLSSSDPEEVALETGIQNGIRFAVEEVNNAGGVDGRPVEIRLGPPAATPDEMVAAAEYLVSQDRVVTLFGGGNSAARRRLAQQLGQTGGLLVYPRSYEGLEEHRSIVYLGLTPNQQMLPAVQFSKASGGERIYLIGNHDAYSQTAARIVSELLGSVDSSLAGLPYFCASNSTLPDLEARIVEARPDVILNTLQGAANRILFQRLNEGRFPTGAPPVVSFRLSRVDLEQIRPEWVEGTVVVGSYFETEDPQNSEFIHRYKKRFGYDQEITDAVEAAYCGVHLWTQAIREAGSERVDSIRQALVGQSLRGPGGILAVDPDTQHAWRMIRFQQVIGGRPTRNVWESRGPIRPVPFPHGLSREAWEKFRLGLEASPRTTAGMVP